MGMEVGEENPLHAGLRLYASEISRTAHADYCLFLGLPLEIRLTVIHS
jgi:hypothetical protein